MSERIHIFVPVSLFIGLVCYVSGLVEMDVKPYPALIYHKAPPETAAVNIIAYDIATGNPLPSISITSGEDGTYFHVTSSRPTEWVLRVKKTIDKPVGYVFDFNVFGSYNGTIRDRNVKINVTEENLYKPEFEKDSYEFLALRNASGYDLTYIGTVKAVDKDNQTYNSVFHYHMFDPIAANYFHVDLITGDIEVIDELPQNIANMTFNVTALDGGSPQKLDKTLVTVKITDLPPPDIFCVAVEEKVARICWKDPTAGSYVMKYELLFQLDGQNTTTIPVHVNGVRDETCSIVRGAQLNRNYTFTVRVFNGFETSPESLQRKVIVTRKGLYGDCPMFSNCSVWEPCENKGECLVNDDLSYTCNCTEGWGGRNCTGVDLCPTDPCNNGSCRYKADSEVTCDCPLEYYGKYCQYYNICSENPCRNNGDCSMLENGGLSCTCAKHFVGMLCDTPDPCTPSPCMNGNCSSLDSLNYACSCTKGYYGRDCEYENTCELEQPCNSGVCHMPDIPETGRQSTWCECGKGYHGNRCQIFDICEVMDENLCKNNGTCQYKDRNSFECLCTYGYWGGECQHYDMCSEKPCASGRCKNISDDTFMCQCEGGHFGRLCERYDSCYGSPCMGAESKCTNTSDSEYLCNCSPARYGRNCEKINGCKLHSCRNNGTCNNASEAGDIFCSCLPGYTGKFCEYYNPCLLSPCQNEGSCTNISRDFVCACVVGYHGDTCQFRDPCVSNPCLNNGNCTIGLDNESYWCFCPTNFYGTYCENVHFCQLHEKCENGATCTILDGMTSREVILKLGPDSIIQANVSNRYTCLCPPGFFGTHCEKKSQCVNQPCGSGYCVQAQDTYICHCPDGSKRKSCFDSSCPEDKRYFDKSGHYVWPRTQSGDTVSLQCHYGPDASSHIHRECAALTNGNAQWKPPESSECTKLEADTVSQSLRDLASWTEDARNLGADEISNITTTLEDMFFFSFTDLKMMDTLTTSEHTIQRLRSLCSVYNTIIQIATTLTSVVGNLLDANETVIIESNSKDHSSDRLLEMLDMYSSGVQSDEPVSIETENINIEVVNITQTDEEYLYKPALETDNKVVPSGISMKLPSEALQSSEDEFPRVQLTTFRSSSFFIPSDHVPDQELVMKQWVVSAVVQGRTVTNLSIPVEIVIRNIEDERNHTCVYWETVDSTWSSQGVDTAERGRNYTKCLSYHLTSFAVILDPSPTFALSEQHEQILTFIAYIGSGISMVGLLLTIITYALFRPRYYSLTRCLNREKSGKILLNLCSSMLLMNAAFILGSETSLSISGDDMCKVVAVLLHYFLLTTLMWMLVEAVNMYQALIKVFTKYSGYFMLKRCVGAWGIPAVIVIITVAIDDDNYKTTTELCFLSHGNPLAFYIALLGPACLILLINTAVFVMVSRVILRPRFHGQVSSSDSLNPAQIRGAFTVMTLLGVTWVFGPFAISEAKLVINYLFTILNSLQGFLIFIFRCCFNPEVRMSWMLLIKTGKFKRRKGPIKAFISDTTSSKAESRINGSVADTLKSNVFNSNSTGNQPNGVSHETTPNGDNQNGQSKAAKDLQAYFDDLHKYKNGDTYKNGRNSDQLVNGHGHKDQILNGNLRRSSESIEGSPYRNSNAYTNGTFRSDNAININGSLYQTSDSVGVTTIYTGNTSRPRRLSRYDIDSDDFTRL